MDISVEPTKDPNNWQVTLSESGQAINSYTVTASPEELSKYGGDREATETITATLNFLLDREGPSSILSKFSLSTVEQYFPEYRTKIKNYF
jgi:hypothetical protein